MAKSPSAKVPTGPPPHQLPDKLVREALGRPENLDDLLQRAVPEVAPGFRCREGACLPREFLTDDWRLRAADVIWKVPYAEPATPPCPINVGLVLEHQSLPDPATPVRAGVEVMGLFERKWHDWSKDHEYGAPLVLDPILVVVLHTGPDPWHGPKSLRDLIQAPDSLRPFQPDVPLTYVGLSERPAEEWLEAPQGFFQALAVVREEKSRDEKRFASIYDAVLERLAANWPPERFRELFKFVVEWSVRRRPEPERSGLLERAERVQNRGPVGPRETTNMVRTIADSLIDEGKVLASRDLLRDLAQERFGPLPEAFLKRIGEAESVSEVQRACLFVIKAASLEELTRLAFPDPGPPPAPPTPAPRRPRRRA